MADILLTIEEEPEISLSVESITEVVTSDYEKLNNLPSINGTTLKGNYAEIDPTVPDWAKDTEPSEITTTSVEFIWSSIFK